MANKNMKMCSTSLLIRNTSTVTQIIKELNHLKLGNITKSEGKSFRWEHTVALTCIYHWWGCNLLLGLWKIYVTAFVVEDMLSCDPAIPFSDHAYVPRPCAPGIFVVAMFILKHTAQNLSPCTVEWIKSDNSHTKNATQQWTLRNLRNMLNEESRSWKDACTVILFI